MKKIVRDAAQVALAAALFGGPMFVYFLFVMKP